MTLSNLASKQWCAFLLAMAFTAMMPISASASTGEETDPIETLDYEALVGPALNFLDQVTSEFEDREVLRDSGRLNHSVEAIIQSISHLYILRADLRDDARELAMRLMTFQEFPDALKNEDIRLNYPADNKQQSIFLSRLVENRKLVWTAFDEIDEKALVGLPEKQPGAKLIIGQYDRGWRPSSPADFVIQSDKDEIIVVNVDEKSE